jgi:hypothetical protein
MHWQRSANVKVFIADIKCFKGTGTVFNTYVLLACAGAVE